METQHVGVLRLHEIASQNRQLTLTELQHLDVCEACRKVFCVISRALNPEESLRQFRELTQETASNP
jgi:hypothetical protein